MKQKIHLMSQDWVPHPSSSDCVRFVFMDVKFCVWKSTFCSSLMVAIQSKFFFLCSAHEQRIDNNNENENLINEKK